ncbi:MAG: GerMN domain-containing protein [Desulfobacterales bacterium]
MGIRRYLLFAIPAVVIAGAVFIIFYLMPRKSSAPEKVKGKIDNPDTQFSQKALVHLYFADQKNLHLMAEDRIVLRPKDPAAFGSIVIKALIKGPQSELTRTIPEGTVLRALYVTSKGTAYVDLSGAIKIDYPGGAQSELMTIFSIVNSLILNIPAVDTVNILVEGRESMTLAGHIDLRFPFKANLLLIR